MEVAAMHAADPVAGVPALRYAVDDPSAVGEVRRASHAMAAPLGDHLAGKVALAATELANNLVLHAGGGEVIIQSVRGGAGAVEILAIDRGRGMANVAQCLSDGYSTAGTPGTGLGAVRRLADDFDIYTAPGEGTVVMARLGALPPVRHGAVNLAMPGEIACGDAWHLKRHDEGIALLVVDGLGHGVFAAEAAQACVASFEADQDGDPAESLERANRAMACTRGGAAACARVRGGSLTYAGIGNISGHLVGPERSQGLASHNGTVGSHTRRPRQFEYRLPARALLVMHTDGVSARWDLKTRPELLARHPAVIAATLYRDHGRGGRDDATVVVVAL